MEPMINCVGLLSNKGISRYRRYVCGGFEPRGPSHHGRSVDRRGCSRETKVLHISRNLPDDGGAHEFVDDRVGDVAYVPTTGEASAS